MTLKVIVAVLLIAAVPVCAHAQNLRVGDAPKVVTIISSDKVKTQSYCDQLRAEFLSAFGALARLCTR